MANKFCEFAWFLIGSAGVLVTGTIAIAIPVIRWSMCTEIKPGEQTEPPRCYPGAVPDIWLQTYQATILAIVLWLVASYVLPFLLGSVTRHPRYRSLQVLWLIVACISGLVVGNWWTERQYPESYWSSISGLVPPVLGIIWTLVITWPIIVGSIEVDVRHRIPTT